MLSITRIRRPKIIRCITFAYLQRMSYSHSLNFFFLRFYFHGFYNYICSMQFLALVFLDFRDFKFFLIGANYSSPVFFSTRSRVICFSGISNVSTDVLSIKTSLNFLNRFHCKGLVKKSAIIFSVGQCFRFISSFLKFYCMVAYKRPLRVPKIIQ